MMNSNNNNDNVLLSEFFFSWNSNNMNNGGMDSNDVNDASLLSSSTTTTGTMDNMLLLNDPLSSLFIDSSMNNINYANQQQEQQQNQTTPFTYNNNDSVFFDLFPQENQQKITGNEPSSSQTMLHYNHPFIVQPFTDSDEPHIVIQQQQQDHDSSCNSSKSGTKRKKSLSIVDEVQQQDKKKPKKKKKKRVNPANAVDVDPNAPPKPKRITGLNKPLILSSALQTIMEGATELSRPEIVKRLWNYIKTNNLQDPADRRFILCDDNLKKIFHQDRVNSFGMNRDLTAHLTKKEVPVEPLMIDVYSMNNNAEPPSSIISSGNNSLMMTDDFSPVPTAETPDIMTPSDSEIFLLKWSNNNSF